MARIRRKAKKRERPLGTAISAGIAVTLGVALVILVVQLLIPGSTMRNYFELLRYTSSATLPLDPLYQQWSETLEKQEALFATPFSLLCGGLTLGWLAPHYATHKRVLRSAAAMSFSVLAILLAFLWIVNLYSTRSLAAQEGGQVAVTTAPAWYLVHQGLWDLAWIVVCVLGTWLGLRLRDRRLPKEQPQDGAPALRSTAR